MDENNELFSDTATPENTADPIHDEPQEEIPADGDETNPAEREPVFDENGQKKPKKQHMSPEKWLDNYWYHHKLITIIVLAFLIIVGICTYQMCTERRNYDLHVIYCGCDNINKNDMDVIEASFVKRTPSDYNDDGEINVDFVNLVWVGETFRDIYAQGGLNYDAGASANARIEFDQEMKNGQMIICLMDYDLYQSVQESSHVFETWDNLLGYTPEHAIDDCAIFVSETKFGQACRGLTNMVGYSYTVLCVRKKGEVTIGQSQEERDRFYQYHVDTVKNIIEYDPQKKK